MCVGRGRLMIIHSGARHLYDKFLKIHEQKDFSKMAADFCSNLILFEAPQTSDQW